MPAYMIVMREEPIQDADAMTQYQTLTRQMHTDIKPLPKVIYGALEALEGEAPDGMVMMEFASMQQAHDWYHSGEYQKVLPYRLRAAKHRAFIVESL
ncbi:DUF1330 domain-containing protein [Aestuariicella hydrocarbonica]|uniref:DUF1330 domain-containing protein n=1 Tax=Pseudomaricurvus hydrocarbonicus TaxID=1470433 RepID=A0A9E5MQ93_9GAMM|nr:DUF1330 domain-containing protein [Aestuariicella hydrocarbonica]NHO68365.1 DUF1330 domain-containing protein [Aestuariicella hydrocarbonica]